MEILGQKDISMNIEYWINIHINSLTDQAMHALLFMGLWQLVYCLSSQECWYSEKWQLGFHCQVKTAETW